MMKENLWKSDKKKCKSAFCMTDNYVNGFWERACLFECVTIHQQFSGL